jgi:hypothetical protein
MYKWHWLFWDLSFAFKRHWFLWLWFGLWGCIVLAFLLAVNYAGARPSGQWALASPEKQAFFKEAKSSNKVSCCGEADAYEADDFDTDPAGNLYAILTCNDPENCEPVAGKVPRQPGTRVQIPPERILGRDPPNRTGHGWVFIAPTEDEHVYCYSFPGGS